MDMISRSSRKVSHIINYGRAHTTVGFSDTTHEIFNEKFVVCVCERERNDKLENN